MAPDTPTFRISAWFSGHAGTPFILDIPRCSGGFTPFLQVFASIDRKAQTARLDSFDRLSGTEPGSDKERFLLVGIHIKNRNSKSLDQDWVPILAKIAPDVYDPSDMLSETLRGKLYCAVARLRRNTQAHYNILAEPYEGATNDVAFIDPVHTSWGKNPTESILEMTGWTGSAVRRLVMPSEVPAWEDATVQEFLERPASSESHRLLEQLRSQQQLQDKARDRPYNEYADLAEPILIAGIRHTSNGTARANLMAGLRDKYELRCQADRRRTTNWCMRWANQYMQSCERELAAANAELRLQLAREREPSAPKSGPDASPISTSLGHENSIQAKAAPQQKAVELAVSESDLQARGAESTVHGRAPVASVENKPYGDQLSSFEDTGYLGLVDDDFASTFDYADIDLNADNFAEVEVPSWSVSGDRAQQSKLDPELWNLNSQEMVTHARETAQGIEDSNMRFSELDDAASVTPSNSETNHIANAPTATTPAPTDGHSPGQHANRTSDSQSQELASMPNEDKDSDVVMLNADQVLGAVRVPDGQHTEVASLPNENEIPDVAMSDAGHVAAQRPQLLTLDATTTRRLEDFNTQIQVQEESSDDESSEDEGWASGPQINGWFAEGSQ